MMGWYGNGMGPFMLLGGLFWLILFWLILLGVIVWLVTRLLPGSRDEPADPLSRWVGRAALLAAQRDGK